MWASLPESSLAWSTVSTYCSQNSRWNFLALPSWMMQQEAASYINILLPELKVTEFTKMKLLSSPIMNDAARGCIMKKLSEYKRMSDRILLLDDHPGLFLLKNTLSLPCLLFKLRTVPCHHHPELLAVYVKVTRSTTEALSNVQFDANSWSQA